MYEKASVENTTREGNLVGGEISWGWGLVGSTEGSWRLRRKSGAARERVFDPARALDSATRLGQIERGRE